MNIENVAYSISTRIPSAPITSAEKDLFIDLFSKNGSLFETISAEDLNLEDRDQITYLLPKILPGTAIVSSHFTRGNIDPVTGKRHSSWRIVIERRNTLYAGSGRKYSRALLCAILRTQA